MSDVEIRRRRGSRRHLWILMAVAAIIAVAVGLVPVLWKPLSSGAREEFARLTSCPLDRTTVAPLKESLMPRSPAAPPPEVAADPERLAYWRQQRQEENKELDSPDCDVFQVTGCGQQIVFCCAHPSDFAGGQKTTYAGSVQCAPVSSLPADSWTGRGDAAPSVQPAARGADY